MIASLLDEWLTARMEPGQRAWLAQQEAADISQTRFFLSFSACARACHGPLAPATTELQAADAALPGWQPRYWAQVDVARARLLLARCELGHDPVQMLDEIALCADLGESLSIYRSICLLPGPERLVDRAREGLRSNVQLVFESVACDNPYPQQHLPEAAWNQMVLKAFFLDVDVDRIVGLQQRDNPELQRMLRQYSEERQAASRPVDPRLTTLLES